MGICKKKCSRCKEKCRDWALPACWLPSPTRETLKNAVQQQKHMHNDIASHTATPGWSPYPRNHDVAVKFDIKHVATRHDICKHTWNYNTRVWENIASKHTWQFRHQQKHASMLVQLLHSLLHLRRRKWNWYPSIFLASACQKTVNTTNRDGKGTDHIPPQ